MEHVIRMPPKCHNLGGILMTCMFKAEFVMLVSLKVPSGWLVLRGRETFSHGSKRIPQLF